MGAAMDEPGGGDRAVGHRHHRHDPARVVGVLDADPPRRGAGDGVTNHVAPRGEAEVSARQPTERFGGPVDGPPLDHSAGVEVLHASGVRAPYVEGSAGLEAGAFAQRHHLRDLVGAVVDPELTAFEPAHDRVVAVGAEIRFWVAVEHFQRLVPRLLAGDVGGVPAA